jgi:hypothetical protein
MRTVEIVYNQTGQTVEFYPPESVRDLLGVPSSPAASVYNGVDSNDDTAEFTPSVTVDSVSTTVDVASGVTQSQRNLLSVAATTNTAVGTLYQLENALGQREIVEPKGITSADSLTLVHELQYDYPITTSTLKGIKLSFTVDATWVADSTNILAPREPNYRVFWTYTIGGVVYRAQTYLRLVRKPFKVNVSIYDIAKRWPDAQTLDDRARRGQGFKHILAAAIDDVRADILAEGYQPAQFNDNEVVDQLVILRGCYLTAGAYGAPGSRDQELYIREIREEYGSLFTRCISVLKIGIDQSTAGGTAVQPIQRYFFER